MRRTSPTPSTSYFICTLPRSGSWLLSESLEKTGIAGRPREYFEPKLFAGESGVSPEAALETIFRKGTTRNGVFGAKLHWYQFEFAPRLVSSDGAPTMPVPLLLMSRFPNLRYVWLTRRDKVRQAISYYRASTTGQWWNIPGVNADQRADGEVGFDFNRIRYLERVLLDHEAKWQKYFEEFDIEPLVLVYEEFAEQHEQAVYEVMAHVGVSGRPRAAIRTRLQRQSDALTEAWVERYTSLRQQATN